MAGVRRGRVRGLHQPRQPRPHAAGRSARPPAPGPAPRPRRPRAPCPNAPPVAHRLGDRHRPRPVQPALAQRRQHRRPRGDRQAAVHPGLRRPHRPRPRGGHLMHRDIEGVPGERRRHRRLAGHHLGHQLRLQRLRPRHRPLGGRQRLDQRLAVGRADVEPGQRGTQIRSRHSFEHVLYWMENHWGVKGLIHTGDNPTATACAKPSMRGQQRPLPPAQAARRPPAAEQRPSPPAQAARPSAWHPSRGRLGELGEDPPDLSQVETGQPLVAVLAGDPAHQQVGQVVAVGGHPLGLGQRLPHQPSTPQREPAAEPRRPRRSRPAPGRRRTPRARSPQQRGRGRGCPCRGGPRSRGRSPRRARRRRRP